MVDHWPQLSRLPQFLSDTFGTSTTADRPKFEPQYHLTSRGWRMILGQRPHVLGSKWWPISLGWGPKSVWQKLRQPWKLRPVVDHLTSRGQRMILGQRPHVLGSKWWPISLGWGLKSVWQKLRQPWKLRPVVIRTFNLKRSMDDFGQCLWSWWCIMMVVFALDFRKKGRIKIFAEGILGSGH